MGKNHFNKLSALCVSLLTAAALLAAFPVSAGAAEQKYISSIGTSTGENGETDLLGRGFNVFHPMFSGKNGEGLWIGYQTTSDTASAITQLQAETDGSFTWKTGGDKAPVLSLYFMSSTLNGESDFNNVMPIPNNGAVVMPGSDGNPAMFNTDSGQGYLAVIHKDVWKNYIADVASATADTKKNAVTQLYKNGCEYYYDKDRSRVLDMKGNAIAIKESLDGVKEQNLKLYLSDLFERFYEIQNRFEDDCYYDKREDINWI